MGKRRESLKERAERDESPESIHSPTSHRKHKKHKKKHKKRVSEDQDNISEIGSPKAPLKLKLKIGTETLGTKDVVTVKTEPIDTFVNVTDEPWGSNVTKSKQTNFKGVVTVKTEPDDTFVNVTDEPWDADDYDPTIKTKKAGDETSDEEKEWLTALEKGELDDYGEVSKGRKDPSLMTARQRALKHGTQDQELLQLPTGYRQVELTEEQLKRREQRASKRKQMAQEKREKDKRQTIDRLLKKQEGRKGKGRGGKKTEAPKVTYVNNASGITVSVPEGIQFPFESQKAEKPPTRPKCVIKGCRNDKKYSCSKTGVALCSLECYKKNLICHKLTPPGLITT